MGQKVSISDYAEYAALTKGREVIHAMLWDTLLFTNATTLQLIFFQQTMAALTPDVTNMQNAGMLPFPKKFLIRALRFFVKQRPESVIDGGAGVILDAYSNVALLANTGVLSINIGDKEFGRYPLRSIPPGNAPDPHIAVIDVGSAGIVGGTVAYGQNGLPSSPPFTLAVPLLIETSQNFNVTLSWPAVITLTRNTNLCVCLEGDEIRAVQ
jgi:hypothetical protein